MKHLWITFLVMLLVGCTPYTELSDMVWVTGTPTLEPSTPELREICHQENWYYLKDRSAQCEAWKLAEDKLNCDFYRLLKTAQERHRVRSLDKQNVLDAVMFNPDFSALFEARLWLAENRLAIIPDLIELLGNRTVVGLSNADDLVISERIDSRDLEFHAHGWVIDDDLFQVAGRASWLLKEATNINLGSVSMHSSDQDLAELQRQWRLWYAHFDCK